MKKNYPAQALILIVIVLFIVFFLVAAVTQNLVNQGSSTTQNQNKQKAIDAANSGLTNAKSYLSTNTVTSPFTTTCTYNTNYTCNYTINPQTGIDEVVQPGQDVSFNLNNLTSTTISYDDPSSFLVLNIEDNSQVNHVCMYYPQWPSSNQVSGYSTFSVYAQNKNAPGANVNLFNTPQDSVCGSNGYALGYSAGYYTLSNLSLLSLKSVRISFLNYTYNNPHLKATFTSSGAMPIQQYQLVSTGVYSGSRETLVSVLSTVGTVPDIFNYVLYNASTNPISF